MHAGGTTGHGDFRTPVSRYVERGALPGRRTQYRPGGSAGVPAFGIRGESGGPGVPASQRAGRRATRTRSGTTGIMKDVTRPVAGLASGTSSQ
jgi:hypothetical protein